MNFVMNCYDRNTASATTPSLTFSWTAPSSNGFWPLDSPPVFLKSLSSGPDDSKHVFFDKYSSPLSISKGLHLQLWGRDVRCCGWNNAGAHESRDCSRKSLFGIQNQHKNWSLAQFLFFCIVAPFKKRDSWIFGLIIVEMFRMQIYAFSRIFFHPPLLVWDPNFDPREFPHETYSYICSARIGMLVVLKQRRIPRQVV